DGRRVERIAVHVEAAGDAAAAGVAGPADALPAADDVALLHGDLVVVGAPRLAARVLRDELAVLDARVRARVRRDPRGRGRAVRRRAVAEVHVEGPEARSVLARVLDDDGVSSAGVHEQHLADDAVAHRDDLERRIVARLHAGPRVVEAAVRLARVVEPSL